MSTVFRSFLYYSLILYFISIIVFLQNYNQVTYIINIFLWISFIIVIVSERIKVFSVNGVINYYFFFILYGLFSSFWAIETFDTIFRSLQLFIILINLFVIWNAFEKFNFEYTFIYGILISVIINYLLIFGVFHVPFDIVMQGGGARVMGTVGSPNTLALLMILSMLVSIYVIEVKNNINKFIYFLLYVNIFVSLYIIVLTISKKGILFGFFLFFIYILFLLKRVKNILKIFISLILFSVAIYNFVGIETLNNNLERVKSRFSYMSEAFESKVVTLNSTTYRKILIKDGLEKFQNKPLLGYGLDNYKYVSVIKEYAHNNYVELLASLGIIGTFLYYAMYVYTLNEIRYMRKSNIKYFLFIFLLVILLMDIALVSYGSRMHLYTLIFISFIIRKHIIKENRIKI
jgi:O-antigen ligase